MARERERGHSEGAEDVRLKQVYVTGGSWVPMVAVSSEDRMMTGVAHPRALPVL